MKPRQGTRGRPNHSVYSLAGKNLIRDSIRKLYRANAPDAERDSDFVRRYQAGETLAQIGAAYGLTRERVRQRLACHGITKADGGRVIRTFLTRRDEAVRQKERATDIEGRFFARWGMSREEMRALSLLPHSDPRSPLSKFCQQRKNAHRRNIGWELTFRQWWDIWQDSGKWNERGRAKDAYVMARWGDSGPYSVENVHICTLAENSAEHWIPRRLREAA